MAQTWQPACYLGLKSHLFSYLPQKTGNSLDRAPSLALVLCHGNRQTFLMSTGTMELVQETASPYQEKASAYPETVSPYGPYRRVLLSSAQIKELSTPKPWRAL